MTIHFQDGRGTANAPKTSTMTDLMWEQKPIPHSIWFSFNIQYGVRAILNYEKIA